MLILQSAEDNISVVFAFGTIRIYPARRNTDNAKITAEEKTEDFFRLSFRRPTSLATEIATTIREAVTARVPAEYRK